MYNFTVVAQYASSLPGIMSFFAAYMASVVPAVGY